MNGHRDLPDRLAQARSYLRSAEDILPLKDYKLTVHAAQLALELSAKTIIGYYHEPEWSHNPSADLLNIIRVHGKTLEKRLGKATVSQMRRLAADAKQNAKWHAWSTYGSDEPGQPYQSPDELCTAEVVAALMPRARHAVALAARFAEVFS